MPGALALRPKALPNAVMALGGYTGSRRRALQRCLKHRLESDQTQQQVSGFSRAGKELLKAAIAQVEIGRGSVASCPLYSRRECASYANGANALAPKPAGWLTWAQELATRPNWAGKSNVEAALSREQCRWISGPMLSEQTALWLKRNYAASLAVGNCRFV